ncbi:MAG: methyltransferase domain-containing protein, partial [Thermoproteota archaeon]
MSKHNHYLKYLSEFLGKLPEDILFSSASLSMFKDNPRLAASTLLFLDTYLRSNRINFLDLGCGYGYLTVLFKDMLGFKNAYGVDIDEERLRVAESLGIITCRLDLEKDLLPFPENYFSLAT